MTARGFWALAPESRNTRPGLLANIGNSRLSARGSNRPGPGWTLLRVAVVILIPPTSPTAGQDAKASARAVAATRPARPPPGQRPRSVGAAPARARCRASSDRTALLRRDRRLRR